MFKVTYTQWRISADNIMRVSGVCEGCIEIYGSHCQNKKLPADKGFKFTEDYLKAHPKCKF